MMIIINKTNIAKYGKTINGGHGKIIKCKEIRLFDDDLPIGDVFEINSITIAIKSLIEKKKYFIQKLH